MRTTEVSIPDCNMRGPIDRTTEIRDLKDPPEQLWKTVAKAKCGYNFQTDVGVGGSRLMALLDTGSSNQSCRKR